MDDRLREVRRLGALQGAELNVAKEILANEATRLAHGPEAAEVAARAAGGVFGEEQRNDGLPILVISQERWKAGVTLAELAAEGGLTASKSAARRLAIGGGLRVNGRPAEQADALLPAGATEWRLSAGRKQHLRIVLAY